MEKTKQMDSKYVQQHLANERTFLAWVRTAITIIGLGFLAAGVVFRTTTYEHIGHVIAAIIGVGAVVIGGIVIGMATIDYKAKHRAINDETFRSPSVIIWFVVTSFAVIQVFLIILVIVMLLY